MSLSWLLAILGAVLPFLVVVAALGAGALLVKPLLGHAAITFIAVEALLGIVGGLSAAALYVVFAFVDGSTWVLAVSTALIGGLVGADGAVTVLKAKTPLDAGEIIDAAVGPSTSASALAMLR